MKIELTCVAAKNVEGKPVEYYYRRNMYTITDMNFHERTDKDVQFSDLPYNCVVSMPSGELSFCLESYDDIRRTLIANGFCMEVDTLLTDDDEGEYGANGDADYEGDGEDPTTGPSARELLSYDDPRETAPQGTAPQSLSQGGVGTSATEPVPPSSGAPESAQTDSPAPDQK
jgi:hypothetical protein